MSISRIQQFFAQNKKIIYTINIVIKPLFKGKLGRSFKIILVEQISITIFKLKYNLPDRLLEDLFGIEHVTISRIINRISSYLSKFSFVKNTDNDEFYIVDSTTVRIGREKSKNTYSGYKHHHGVKFQVIINEFFFIKAISKRIKIEHIFAKMKNFRILHRLNYYKISKIDMFFNAIANIVNLLFHYETSFLYFYFIVIFTTFL